MAAAQEDVHVSGHCYCGGVTFDVDIPKGASPLFAVYCHCDSCRRSHAAPLYHVVCLDEAMLKITKGEDLPKGYSKRSKDFSRDFCSACGSRVRNRFGDWKPDGITPVAMFPNLLDAATQHAMPDVLKAQSNHLAEECVLERAVLDQLFEDG
ncbi:MAG: GFA family protein [Alphaproteobacteria bacterium]|jgi:hypothetical protein|nr:hypothetical protein [Rhodospirillaceae bacterium]MDG2480673.1 GFA family protein [Alphaproteobacteria bacterium]MBT6203993.1 hypothetical protein [Rhodospirillaceae bacterium]MBT6509314.1 hypothetical protein [Rhodospirillaceae bacterium]MBT7614858.1 hypothetical protein [Rhodospirillaceae bacterium]